MLNSIMTLKINSHGHNKGWEALVPLGLTVMSLIVVFGIYPSSALFWAHCRLAEWGVLAFVILFFIKDIWIKSFLIISLISLVKVSLTYPEKAGASAFIYFYYIFLFGIMFQILNDKIDQFHIKTIINGLCIIAILQTCYIWLQHFRIDPFFKGLIGQDSYLAMDVKDLVVGTWAHTNLAGAYLACSLPLFLRKKWFIFIPFILLALFWGRSWGAIIACTFAVAFWSFFMFKGKLKFILPMIALFTMIVYGSFFEHRQFNPFKSDRLQYIKPTIKMIMTRPFGWGLGQYKNSVYTISKRIFEKDILKTHAHFDLLESVFELGILSSIPIIGFLIYLFIHFLNNQTPFSLSAMAGGITLLINSCSTFVFRTPLTWIFLIYLIIIIKERKENYVNSVFRAEI